MSYDKLVPSAAKKLNWLQFANHNWLCSVTTNFEFNINYQATIIINKQKHLAKMCMKLNPKQISNCNVISNEKHIDT
jgi:flagellar assembly factor FliW